MNETDIDEVQETKLNYEKMSVEELRKVPVTSHNSATLTRLILNKQPKVEINIPATEKDKKKVFLAINGHNYHIPRGKWVAVPQDVAKLLERMIQKTYRTSERKDEDGRAQIEENTIPRFGYQTRPIQSVPAPDLNAKRK